MFLTEAETVELSYSDIRDRVIFTDKKLIASDIKGITESKKEFKIFPYSKITSFSVKTAYSFYGDSDFKIWVSGVGMFEIKFSKRLDIKRVGKFLTDKVG